ncbi:DUF3052 domain-containing protein [Streptomyces sp. NPDC026659]|uniref:DUF3052 domain-containing protein n=1 Tax=Streptomyces sp. NPDC026659 TaxID=3155123 RepID=UPI00340A852E
MDQSLADRLGIRPGQIVQEIGWDEDSDDELRAAVKERTGSELTDEDSEDVADVVLLWWREGDGDLVDALSDAQAVLADGGTIWLLTPKPGRDGHVEAGDIGEDVTTAGLAHGSSVAVAENWSATRLTGPRDRR